MVNETILGVAGSLSSLKFLDKGHACPVCYSNTVVRRRLCKFRDKIKGVVSIFTELAQGRISLAVSMSVCVLVCMTVPNQLVVNYDQAVIVLLLHHTQLFQPTVLRRFKCTPAKTGPGWQIEYFFLWIQCIWPLRHKCQCQS